MQLLSTNKTSSPAAIKCVKDFVQTLFNDQLSLVREQKDDVIQRIIHRQQHREIFRVLLRRRNHQLLDKKENRLC